MLIIKTTAYVSTNKVNGTVKSLISGVLSHIPKCWWHVVLSLILYVFLKQKIRADNIYFALSEETVIF